MSLGAPHNKLIIGIPATATQFTLKNPQQNTPRSPVADGKEAITQTEVNTTFVHVYWPAPFATL
jgi:hypothetical protein